MTVALKVGAIMNMVVLTTTTTVYIIPIVIITTASWTIGFQAFTPFFATVLDICIQATVLIAITYQGLALYATVAAPDARASSSVVGVVSDVRTAGRTTKINYDQSLYDGCGRESAELHTRTPPNFTRNGRSHYLSTHHLRQPQCCCCDNNNTANKSGERRRPANCTSASGVGSSTGIAAASTTAGPLTITKNGLPNLQVHVGRN